jgi:hypothetical protein
MTTGTPPHVRNDECRNERQTIVIVSRPTLVSWAGHGYRLGDWVIPNVSDLLLATPGRTSKVTNACVACGTGNTTAAQSTELIATRRFCRNNVVAGIHHRRSLSHVSRKRLLLEPKANDKRR